MKINLFLIFNQYIMIESKTYFSFLRFLCRKYINYGFLIFKLGFKNILFTLFFFILRIEIKRFKIKNHKINLIFLFKNTNIFIYHFIHKTLNYYDLNFLSKIKIKNINLFIFNFNQKYLFPNFLTLRIRI